MATSMIIDPTPLIRREENAVTDGMGDSPSNGGTAESPISTTERHKRTTPMDIFELMSGSPSKKKRKKVPVQSQPKNAVCALNELRPGLVYTTIDQSGPVHAPTFTVSVEVNGQQFEGQGRSKKLAKHAAAEAALRSFVQFKNAPEAQQAMNMHIADLDFTSDITESEGDLFNAFQPGHTTGPETPTANEGHDGVGTGSPAALQAGSNAYQKTNKNMKLVGENLSSLHQEDSFDIFGKHIANKLRSIKKEQNLLAQKLIIDVLFEAEMDTLTRSYKVKDSEKTNFDTNKTSRMKLHSTS